MQKWIRVAVLLVLSLGLVAGALAQETFTSADGLVAFSLPTGWQAEEDGTRVFVANTLEGLDIGRQGNAAQPGTIWLLITATANIPEVNSDADIAPADLIDSFLSMTGMEGEIFDDTINGFPVVQAQVTTADTELNNTEAGIVGVATPNGTVFIIIETGDELADYAVELIQIIESMTLASPARPATEEADTSGSAEAIRQWATGASATSQYGSTSWSAAQATGQPNTTQCGDYTTAWASATSTGSDSLTLEFAQAVIPAQVNIHQTYNPGSIIEVRLVTEAGEVIAVPDSADPPGSTACPGVYALEIADVAEPITGVTIVLDQTIGGGWNEIDAVELVGFDPAAAPASALGPVDAAALLGDDVKTWEPETGIVLPYPADFVELSVTDTYFSVMNADMTTIFTHFARPPFPINATGAGAVDTIISMFYSGFSFDAEDAIDVLGDGSITLGFAETNSGAQVAFYAYEVDGDPYFLQVEALTDGSDTPFFPIAPDMLALGQAMVQAILGN